MLKVFFISASSIAIAATSAFADEDCFSITNDIARLACYDAGASSSPAKVTVTPEEAFEVFRIFSSDPWQIADFGQISLDYKFKDCVLEGSETEYKDEYYGGERLNIQYFRVDLRNTTEVIGSSMSSLHASITQGRDAPVTLVGAAVKPPSAPPFFGHASIDWARQFAPDTNWVGTYEHIRRQDRRTAAVKVSREREDTQQAITYLKDIVSACNQS